MKWVVLDRDTVLHHVATGSGPQTVFLLHGFLGSGRNLGALTRRFTAQDPQMKVVQVDLPGHGKSPGLSPDASLQDLAKEVAQLADHLSVPKFRIVGHSMGGRVGLAMLDAHAERVVRLDLLDITPGPTHHLPVGDVINPLLAAPDQAPDRRTMQTFFRESGLSAAMTDWLLMNLDKDAAGYRWRIDRRALATLHQRHGFADLWSVVERYPERIWTIRGGDSKYLSDADATRMTRLGIPVRTFRRGCPH
ncbi:MAG: alpha/beta fold hydrolase, partial [Myxococcota bacterium]